jgi:hypothetical protein
MNARSLVCSTLAVSVLLFGTRAANAACSISDVGPTAPLPTMDDGQEFSFHATPDCATLRFRVQGTSLSKIPKGPLGSGGLYRVTLTESEWNSVFDEAVDEGATTISWSITGKTSAGVTTRVTTTNELIVRRLTVDLSATDAKIVGERVGSFLGSSVSGAGDMNGDGRDDILLGSETDQEGGLSAGAAFIVMGPVTGTVDLATTGAKLVGERGDHAGFTVAAAGDVNGDDQDDVLIGAKEKNEGGGGAGGAYLVLGPVTADLDLGLADAQLIGEEASDHARAVAGAGDVNGDGHDDLLIGAPGPIGRGRYTAGAAYLVLGPVTGTLDLSLADAKFVGEGSHDMAGASVSGAGDVDGDGQDDFLIGSIGYAAGGAVYLLLGPTTGTLDLSLADAKLRGHGQAGICSGAGDVDGDGHDDVLVGAPTTSPTGAAHLVLGPITGPFDLVHADATFVGDGEEPIYPIERVGMSVSGAGDVDGNGHDDVLIGAPYNDEGGDTAGAAYLVLGPVTGTFDLTMADAFFVGEAIFDKAGDTTGVSGAGDVDGDGRADVLIGAHNNDGGGSSAGAAYLIYGASLF